MLETKGTLKPISPKTSWYQWVMKAQCPTAVESRARLGTQAIPGLYNFASLLTFVYSANEPLKS
jgi:hypothetical protein